MESTDPLCQALHMRILVQKRHFLPPRNCLHCHGLAAVSSNSWQETSKVLITVQTHNPGVYPFRPQHGCVAPAEKVPKGSHLLPNTFYFNPIGQPATPPQQEPAVTNNHSQQGLKINHPVQGSRIIQREDRQNSSALLCKT